MRIAIWPPREDACSKYRLDLPAKTLMDQGLDVYIDPNGVYTHWNIRLGQEDAPTDFHHVVGIEDYDADVVVMQRPASRVVAEIIPFLQAKGIRVVIDVDDRYDKIHPNNAAYIHFDPNYAASHNYQWIFKACELADAVTATTPALIEKYGFGHGHVIPNYVPEYYFDIQSEKETNSIGWGGFVVTHPGDLRVMGSTIKSVCDTTGYHFKVIGPSDGVQNEIETGEGFTFTGKVGLEEYVEEMATLEIGVVPLADNAFNQSKSALKMCELASVGVPVVASPTPDNLRLNAMGVGIIANTPQKWLKFLKSLALNENRRQDVAGRGLEVMKTQTYEKNAYKWAEVWTGSR